jgi:hypothetical protein
MKRSCLLFLLLTATIVRAQSSCTDAPAVISSAPTTHVSATGGSNVSGDHSTDSRTPPTELTSIISSTNGAAVTLTWITAREEHNCGFEVQRLTACDNCADHKPQNTDSGEWMKIGYIEDTGTIHEPKAFSYTDKNLAVGIYSYRLKQIDCDGRFVYSKAMEAAVTGMPGKRDLQRTCPDICNRTAVSFTAPENGRARLNIYNSIGQWVATLFDGYAKTGSVQNVVFDSSALPSGVYYSHLQLNSTHSLKKILVLK